MTHAQGLNLKNPKAITSTHLRKHIATVCKVLHLEEKELDWLAWHMGCDIRILREYYRLHESTTELAKVSKILAIVDEGSISFVDWEANLDQIDVDVNDGKCIN